MILNVWRKNHRDLEGFKMKIKEKSWGLPRKRVGRGVNQHPPKKSLHVRLWGDVSARAPQPASQV